MLVRPARRSARTRAPTTSISTQRPSQPEQSGANSDPTHDQGSVRRTLLPRPGAFYAASLVVEDRAAIFQPRHCGVSDSVNERSAFAGLSSMGGTGLEMGKTLID